MSAAVAALVTLAAVGAPDAANHDHAKQLFRAGAAAYEAGRYLAAAQALEQAYQLSPLPAVAFSLAQAYRLQFFADEDHRHLDRAVALYRLYIDRVKRGGRRADAVSALADLQPIKARLEQQRAVRAPDPINTQPEAYEPPTQLMVISDTSGARGAIDGRAQADLPLIVEVKPGKHIARISAPGYHPAEQEIIAVENRLVVAEVELTPKPALLTVEGVSGAALWVNGRRMATLPLSGPISLPAGRYLLTLTHTGHRAWARDITVERGGTAALIAQPETTLQRDLSYYVFAAAGATMASSGVIGLLALTDDQDATRLLDKRDVEGLTVAERDDYESLVIRRNNRTATSVVLLGAAAALAITGSLLFALDDPRPVADAVSVRADVGLVPIDGGGLVSLSGTF